MIDGKDNVTHTLVLRPVPTTGPVTPPKPPVGSNEVFEGGEIYPSK